jgi:integrase
MLKEPSGRARYLSDDEETRLVAMLATDSERDRIRILIHTGLRKSEFANLRWKDVDLRAGVVTIPRSKNGETRHVPMTSVVRALLGRMPVHSIPQCLCFRAATAPLTPHWVETAFPEAVRAARIQDFRFHDLRHTFASRLAMEGVGLLTIKDLGGWKTLSMVQRYSHLSPSHRNHAIERLATRKIERESATPGGVAL